MAGGSPSSSARRTLRSFLGEATREGAPALCSDPARGLLLSSIVRVPTLIVAAAALMLVGCDGPPSSEIRDNGPGGGSVRPRTPRGDAAAPLAMTTDSGPRPNAVETPRPDPNRDAGASDAATPDAMLEEAPIATDASLPDGVVSTEIYQFVTIGFGVFGQIGVPATGGIVPEPRRLVELFQWASDDGRPMTEPIEVTATDEHGFFQIEVSPGYYSICVHGADCATADLPYYQARCDFTGEWSCTPY